MTDSPFNLPGQTALITGGGTGLGLGMARCFVRSGARVVLVGRREAELAEAVRALGEASSMVVHDVTQLDRAGELIQRAEAAARSPISVLINNAGVHLKKKADETTPAEFDAVMQTHVHAAHALCAAVIPGMAQRREGHILFTASMASLIGIPMVIAYSAAKAAHLGMVRSLATEVAAQGIRVNAIAPGWIDSPMLRQAMTNDPARQAKILGRTPMAKFGDAEDIGWAAVYLSSPAARFITGVCLPVDGGASIGF